MDRVRGRAPIHVSLSLRAGREAHFFEGKFSSGSCFRRAQQGFGYDPMFVPDANPADRGWTLDKACNHTAPALCPLCGRLRRAGNPDDAGFGVLYPLPFCASKCPYAILTAKSDRGVESHGSSPPFAGVADDAARIGPRVTASSSGRHAIAMQPGDAAASLMRSAALGIYPRGRSDTGANRRRRGGPVPRLPAPVSRSRSA